MVSSELDEMLEGSARVIVLRNGSAVGMLSGEDLTEENLMAMLAEGRSSENGEEVHE
jgi:ribose transport system ATP-binding protein